jgi:putative sigma-54 modulation protein
MQIQVHYQGLEHTQWMDDFINTKIQKLDRYLSPDAHIQVNVKLGNQQYVTSVVVHSFRHDYSFGGEGENFYESLTDAVEKTARALSEDKKKAKNRIHRKFNIDSELSI